ncbi:hypothetical protein CLOSTMETH_01680 [[Clostridium] methylpentosum DSM 5476]|uniref:Uncharacterized protein n=1 Tax=[Clostridium] methylpentosum DSM 5476 TaxID=537013 RepID=C0ECV9_9FIRM|nr:hypothetical protein CLOSTMETH_01680 [[Clostridium] methylpentosum DSM 5476]
MMYHFQIAQNKSNTKGGISPPKPSVTKHQAQPVIWLRLTNFYSSAIVPV